jgi:protein SMG6
MTVLHPFSTARESVQNLFGNALTAKRLQPEAKAAELFVVLHGMLFTNIQLDEFETILARFLEKLQLDVLEEREWIMMAVTNLAAVLDYGKSYGVLRSAGVIGEKKDTKETEKPRAGLKRKNEATAPIPEEEDVTRKMDVDEPEETEEAQQEESTNDGSPRSADDVPVSFSLALRLTFSMFRYVLRHPKLRRTPVAPSSLNPYIPVMFTFLATMFRHPRAIALMERSLPWEEMTAFLGTLHAAC